MWRLGMPVDAHIGKICITGSKMPILCNIQDGQLLGVDKLKSSPMGKEEVVTTPSINQYYHAILFYSRYFSLISCIWVNAPLRFEYKPL